MSNEEVPIWEVIEEFKGKIKKQEAEIKKRREKLDAKEKRLN